MSGIEAFLLGLLQGLTEYLPVSSSGHLMIAKELFGVETQGATLEIVVHAATVLSTIVVFRKQIGQMIVDTVLFRRTENSQLVLRILLSLIPVMVVGFFFKDKVEAFFSGGLNLVGGMLLLTALLLFLAQWLSRKRQGTGHALGFRDAFIIGIAQAFAVIPGLSRSGATISTGLCLGVNKTKVAPFSFLMVLIPVLGETFLELMDGGLAPASSGIPIPSLLIAFATAFVSGMLACRIMLEVVRRVKFVWFALYCALVGVCCLVLPHLL